MPPPTAFGPRGGKVPDVVVSDAASTSVAAGVRRRIAEMTTKTITTTGGHRRRRRRQRSPDLVPTIGREVVAGGNDVNVGGGGGSGGGTYGLIMNRPALHRNWRTPRGGSLTYSIGTGRRRDRGGWRRRTAAAAAARGGRKGCPSLAWRKRTTQQSTKAMETTKVVTTRTANARVKARSGVCKCAIC